MQKRKRKNKFGRGSFNTDSQRISFRLSLIYYRYPVNAFTLFFFCDVCRIFSSNYIAYFLVTSLKFMSRGQEIIDNNSLFRNNGFILDVVVVTLLSKFFDFHIHES